MIDIIDKKDCCGCEACTQICPVQCINVIHDGEGFMYPLVDMDRCVECGMCIDVCPVINPRESILPLAKYASINNDEHIRMKSSSGGVFFALAKQVIEKGGVVFGARFDEQWNVVHDYTETIEGLYAFMGSKYVQSSINDSFIIAEKFLKEERLVMFTATHCQIAGLRNFLGKDWDNLLAVDIICHGVPSNKIWQKYLQETFPEEQIVSVKFRSKNEEGWGRYHINIDTVNMRKSWLYKENPYQKALIENISLRPSCAACCAKKGNSGSDIMLGDYWGVKNISPYMDDDKGTSVVVLFTEKGKSYYQSLNLCSQEIKLKTNEKIHFSSVKMHPKREAFFKSTATIEDTIAILCKETIKQRLQKHFYNMIFRMFGFNTRKRIKRILGL